MVDSKIVAVRLKVDLKYVIFECVSLSDMMNWIMYYNIVKL